MKEEIKEYVEDAIKDAEKVGDHWMYLGIPFPSKEAAEIHKESILGMFDRAADTTGKHVFDEYLGE